jgi:hypothetical protein
VKENFGTQLAQKKPIFPVLPYLNFLLQKIPSKKMM